MVLVEVLQVLQRPFINHDCVSSEVIKKNAAVLCVGKDKEKANCAPSPHEDITGCLYVRQTLTLTKLMHVYTSKS